MRNLLNVFVAVLIGASCVFLPAMADDENSNVREYKIKIAFIYNFLKFVDWPGEHSPKKTNAAKVCIEGDREFGRFFKEFQASHTQGFNIDVEGSVNSDTIPSCTILYIGKDEEPDIASLLAATRHHPVLSISEAKNFADNGGIIELTRVGQNLGLFSQDKIKLRINARVAGENGLTIDARLLQIAAEVIK